MRLEFKGICILMFIAGLPVAAIAQKERFDLVAYTPPKGWKKEVKESAVSYSTIDKKKGTWCQMQIIKSTISRGNILDDFKSEWQGLIVESFHPTDTPQFFEVQESGIWQMKSGIVKFIFNKAPATAMLTTATANDRCISIVVTTNSLAYRSAVDAMLSSVDLKAPGVNVQTVSKPSAAPAKSNNFFFTSTNFDDGWKSTIQEEWVEVSKGTTRVHIHYPNKQADAYNSNLLDGLVNAWNILVAPRYNCTPEYRPVSGWQSIEFAEAEAVEKLTGKRVHVVLFKMNYSNGSGKYLEFITPDKNAFEQEFGPYHQNTYGWEKMENMAGYNRFAVAPSDLKGTWTSNFGSAIQYVNAYTGFDAGMDTHASVENFSFGPGDSYNWDLGVASGPVGNIKFQSVKSSGKFSVVGNWQIKFSLIESRSRTYNAYFSCIKGLRILWLDGKAFAKAD